MTQFPFQIEPMAEQALLLRWPDGNNPRQIRQLQLALSRCDWLSDVVAASTTLALIAAPNGAPLMQQLQQWLADTDINTLPLPARRSHLLPVCYHASLAPDLDYVSQATGLTTAEVIRHHQHSQFVVSSTGFSPGFAYLDGLNPALELPRRAEPRLQVDAGSVAIAAGYSAVYPQRSAAGWHLIGACPLPLLQLQLSPPCRLQLGDTVRFQAISLSQFNHWDPQHD
ncbi:carboxyltransferase domain-containing protein [uncultured Ferrimonas sp.]|uniref:5-oxoprolinase subunit B family protein n=1 Tax=uncultured Ferrimonas sp. TaxID=432640 RepID=UPI002634C240|nr:carboxyltransferase domain-containing protein [uncultured Ferrimonas sp.]